MAAMASAGRWTRRASISLRNSARLLAGSATASRRCGQAGWLTDARPQPLRLSRPGRQAFSVLPAAEVRRPIRHVEQVLDNRDNDSIDLTWNFGDVTPFPYVWLRDSCLCPECFHPSAFSRKLRIDQLDINIQPKSVQNDSSGRQVVVTWPDGHVSRFPYAWLDQRQFTPRQLQHRKKQQAGPRTVLWNRATIEHNLFKIDYKHLLEDLGALRDTLRQLIAYGLLVVRNCPTQFGVVEQLSARLGHTRLTHYGKTFRVASKVNANNLAYTTETLSPHLDTPYYEYVPGVQLLHCISQHVGTGGENTLADSFYVAELIRQARPDLFQLLVTMPIEFDDVGIESESHRDCRFHKVHEHPMFRLDDEGNVIQVCFNNSVRSYRLNVPFSAVKSLYEGMRMFHELCEEQANHLLYKMANGDILVFNNRRVMHGRLGYAVTEDSTRTLEGGYIDWDEIMCRYRTVSDLLTQTGAR